MISLQEVAASGIGRLKQATGIKDSRILIFIIFCSLVLLVGILRVIFSSPSGGCQLYEHVQQLDIEQLASVHSKDLNALVSFYGNVEISRYPNGSLLPGAKVYYLHLNLSEVKLERVDTTLTRLHLTTNCAELIFNMRLNKGGNSSEEFYWSVGAIDMIPLTCITGQIDGLPEGGRIPEDLFGACSMEPFYEHDLDFKISQGFECIHPVLKRCHRPQGSSVSLMMGLIMELDGNREQVERGVFSKPIHRCTNHY